MAMVMDSEEGTNEVILRWFNYFFHFRINYLELFKWDKIQNIKIFIIFW
jgi:hypothetical protein